MIFIQILTKHMNHSIKIIFEVTFITNYVQFMDLSIQSKLHPNSF